MQQSMNAADLVRESRERAGLSRSALAAKAGVPTSTVSRIEEGSSDPTLTMLARLVAAAGRHLSISVTAQRTTGPAIESLADACRQVGPDRKINWPRLRGFLDQLSAHPELVAEAIEAQTRNSRLLGEAAHELANRGLSACLIVVGGSYLALHDLRESTVDVDTVTRLEADIMAVIEAIAHRHDLRADWLNDSAAPFSPAGLRIEDCRILYECEQLTVLGPPAGQVFLMKLLAGRAPDHDDIVPCGPCAISKVLRRQSMPTTRRTRSKSQILTSLTTGNRPPIWPIELTDDGNGDGV
jgi:transcriptional regulator with XRE-family HTH domain